MKLFADDTSIFSIAKDSTKSSNKFNNDLKIINNWAFQWKMSFNHDPLKQKCNQIDHPHLVFNSNIVHKASLQKHLGLKLDDKLNFKEHIDKSSAKLRKV